MTSSDVLDTCLAVQLARASDILLDDIDRLLAALRRRAEEHKFTLCVGRSHGIHAEPITDRLKPAGHYVELARHRPRLEAAGAEIEAGAVSGPVSTSARLTPAATRHLQEKTGPS